MSKAIAVLFAALFALLAPVLAAQQPEAVPAEMGVYAMVLWEPGTPIPDDPAGTLMKRIPPPDLEALGGRVLHGEGHERIVMLPVAAAEEVRGHKAVMYLQRIWTGEPLDRWNEREPRAPRRAIQAESDFDISWDRAYLYDDSGNIRSIGLDHYSYDTAGRLVQSVVNGSVENFKYDSFGNLAEKAIVGKQTVTFPVDGSSNRIVGAGYDEAGNAISREGRRSYSYDALNMLVMAALPTGNGGRRFLYDANDERIGFGMPGDTLMRWTIRDFNGAIIREFRGDFGDYSQYWTWTRDYIYAEGRLIGGESQRWGYTAELRYGGRRHYHLDHLGSVRVVTDDAGRSVSEHDYHAFGVTPTKAHQEMVPNGEIDTMRYAGHSRDFLGMLNVDNTDYLDYMHARFYDPNLGRFLSVDPAWDSAESGRPQTWNRYSYVTNNPVNAVDPDGRQACPTNSAPAVLTDEDRLWENFKKAFLPEIPTAEKPLVLDPQNSPVETWLNVAGITASITPSPGDTAVVKATQQAAKSDMATLWRVVNPTELNDILDTGMFINRGSAEGKYFSTTAEGAASYAKQAVTAFGDAAYTLVTTQIPRNLLPSPTTVDGNVPAVVIRDALLTILKPEVLNYMPLPVH